MFYLPIVKTFFVFHGGYCVCGIQMKKLLKFVKNKDWTKQTSIAFCPNARSVLPKHSKRSAQTLMVYLS